MSHCLISSPHVHIIPIPRTYIISNINMVQSVDSVKLKKHRRIAMAIDLATFLETFVDCWLFFCCLGGRWGDTELVVAQCQHPGASSGALDLLNREIPRASLQRIRMAIKMARDGGVLLLHRRFCYQQ
jgi:hypothetical protein